MRCLILAALALLCASPAVAKPAPVKPFLCGIFREGPVGVAGQPHPELVGQIGRVLRSARKGNTAWVEIAVGSERHIVVYDFTPNTVPAVMGHTATEEVKAPWRRNGKPPVFACDGLGPAGGGCGAIYDGPLGGLMSDQRPCS